MFSLFSRKYVIYCSLALPIVFWGQHGCVSECRSDNDNDNDNDSPFTGSVPLCLPNFPNKMLRKQVLTGDRVHDAEWYVSYNKRTRIPDYVYERHIIDCSKGANQSSRESNNNISRQHAHFHAESDKVLSSQFKTFPNEYSHNVGEFDRGHMCASANFGGSQEELGRTFTMTNICPQNKRLNMGIWKLLEQWIRTDLLEKRYTEGEHSTGNGGDIHEVIIVTGPAFLPVQCEGEFVYINKTIGVYPKLIHVPTHFFKVIITIQRSRPGKGSAEWALDVSAGAFLFPNTSSPPGPGAAMVHSAAKAGRFESFAVQFRELETLVGLQFLPPVGNDISFVDSGCSSNAVRQAIYKLDALVQPLQHNGVMGDDLGSALGGCGSESGSDQSVSPRGFREKSKQGKPIILLDGGADDMHLGPVVVRHLCQQPSRKHKGNSRNRKP